jgi:hypothetical protein
MEQSCPHWLLLMVDQRQRLADQLPGPGWVPGSVRHLSAT